MCRITHSHHDSLSHWLSYSCHHSVWQRVVNNILKVMIVPYPLLSRAVGHCLSHRGGGAPWAPKQKVFQSPQDDRYEGNILPCILWDIHIETVQKKMEKIERSVTATVRKFFKMWKIANFVLKSDMNTIDVQKFPWRIYWKIESIKMTSSRIFL